MTLQLSFLRNLLFFNLLSTGQTHNLHCKFRSTHLIKKNDQTATFLTLRRDIFIQTQALPAGYSSLCSPYLQFLHAMLPNFCQKLGQFYIAFIRTDNNPESDSPVLSLLMFPLLFGSNPLLNWIKCNMNCTLRYDDKATQTIPHSQISIRIIWASPGS